MISKKMKAIVVGANRGLGLALCKKLKEEKFFVYALCRKSSKELHELDVKVIENVDVSDKKLIEDVAKLLQNEKIDLLIHNAGIAIRDTLDSIEQKNLMRQFEVNTLGPLWTTSSFLPLMKPYSKIIFISSRAGSIGDNPAPKNYGYRMSKAALNMLGVTLSHDLKKNHIALGLLHPGFVKTDMTDYKGSITSEESANSLFQIIEKINLNNSGRFWHFSGKELPW